jgi:hypothetical protein
MPFGVCVCVCVYVCVYNTACVTQSNQYLGPLRVCVCVCVCVLYVYIYLSAQYSVREARQPVLWPLNRVRDSSRRQRSRLDQWR